MVAITNDSQALLQGVLTGTLIQMWGDYERGDGKSFLKINRVEPVRDEEGNYTNQTRVLLDSGTVLTVTVSEETEIAEEVS